MIVALLAAALAAQAAPDPCAPFAPGAPDGATAAAYELVAQEEQAAGREDSAIVAYRAALERDPGLATARAALDAMCTARRRASAFARGLERVQAGDCRGALPALDEARAAKDPGAALLAGVCRYQLGEDQGAGEALREAAADEQTRPSAELYLGLLALRGGRADEASALLRSAAADPTLAPIARELARDARREGRVVLSVLAEAGWDSNAELAPGDALSPSGSSDGLAGGTVLLTIAPWRERGPYARGAATLQVQAQRDELDLGAVTAAAGLPLGSGSRVLLLEYAYDLRRVGGAPYLSAHGLLADGRAVLRRGLTGGAAYSLRSETFRTPEAADDSGLRHALQLDATASVRSVRLTAGWQGSWNTARAEWRGFAEHGPLVGLAGRPSARTRAAFELGLAWRSYLAADPELERRRRDVYLDATGRLDLDVAEGWTAYLTVVARKAFSNVADLRYARIVPTAGLSYTAGLF